MNTSLRTSKVASVFTTLTACLGLALGSAGCAFQGAATLTTDPAPGNPAPPASAVAQIPVDPGGSMSSQPGSGVGLFVQYDLGGHWNLFTTCDTQISGASCSFEVVVSAGAGVTLDKVRGVGLEPSDSVTLEPNGSIRLVTDTSFGSDGLAFDADPGALIEVDMLLDGVAQPRFVFVVSQGVLVSGVPSNPVDFAPRDAAQR